MDKEQVREKHLEFVQANIARMNQCSFQMKGWAITIIVALFTVFVATLDANKNGQVFYLFMGALSAVIFWCLDAYYLSQERRFIAIYNVVAGINKDVDIQCYEINPRRFKGWQFSIWKALLSPPNLLLYGFLFLALFVLGIAL